MVRVETAMVLELVPEQLQAYSSVVIDVLRATSTIVAALTAEIPYIVPVATVAEARAYDKSGACYLGGERQRLRPEGFHFGNSPLEYLNIEQPQPLIFTTTNGTRALQRVQGSSSILVASFSNAAAVAQALLQTNAPVLLVCAGTRGKIAAEDVLCAGLLIQEMQNRATLQLSDAAQIALSSYQHAAANLTESLLQTDSGRALAQLGWQRDVLYAAQINQVPLVPYYKDGRIVAGNLGALP